MLTSGRKSFGLQTQADQMPGTCGLLLHPSQEKLHAFISVSMPGKDWKLLNEKNIVLIPGFCFWRILVAFCFAYKETSLDCKCWKFKLGAPLCNDARLVLPFPFPSQCLSVSLRRNPHLRKWNSQSCPSWNNRTRLFVQPQPLPSWRPPSLPSWRLASAFFWAGPSLFFRFSAGPAVSSTSAATFSSATPALRRQSRASSKMVSLCFARS